MAESPAKLMTSGLATRIAMVLAVILVASIATTTLLSVHKYERTLADFLNSRLTFVVSDARARIQTQMDLGLPLTDLQGVSEALQEYLEVDSQILSIEVFDEFGAVLFSTDPSLIGDLVAENWVNAWRSSLGRNSWFELEQDAGVVGVPLRNNLSQEVGSLALRYSREFLDRSVADQASRLSFISVAVVLGIAPLCVLGAILLLRRPTRALTSLGVALGDLSSRRGDATTIQAVRAESSGFDGFVAAALEAHDKMDGASREIRRLDEEEAV